MKCSIMLHFIWVFTVCKSTHLGVSRIQRVNRIPIHIDTISMVLIAYAQMPLINAHADVISTARGLSFGMSIQLHPCFVYTSSKGSGELPEP